MREVFDDAAMLEGAMKLASKLAEGPTRALVATRQLLEESEHSSFAAHFRREMNVQAGIREGEDALESRKAFTEKRPPRFTGR